MKSEREINATVEDRERDILIFWQSFQRFRSVNTNLEDNFRDLLRQHYGYDDELIETGVEAFMVYVCGATLAKNEARHLTDAIPIPLHELVVDDSDLESFMSWGEGHMTELGVVITNSGVLVSLERLTNPENHFYPQTRDFVSENKKTVSRYLSDRAVVDLVLAGVEEYAHEVFQRVKKGDKLASSVMEAKQKTELMKILNASGENNLAAMIGNSSDIEYRALIWQLCILNKYLPAFAEPTRIHIREIEEMRRKRRKLIIKNPAST